MTALKKADPSTSQYVIRGYIDGYNDECYYDAGYCISGIYEDLNTAETDLRQLQLERVKEIPLSEANSLWNGDPALLVKVEKYIKDKTGLELLDERGFIKRDVDFLENLTDDDLLTLGGMIYTLGYEILELTGNQKFYVLWNTAEDEPFLSFDDSGDFLMYSQSEEDLVEEAEGVLNFFLEDDFEGNGTYEQLSDSPELLRSLVESTKGLKYKKSIPVLEIVGELDTDILKSLNELLKKPFYNFKEMSAEEIVELE